MAIEKLDARAERWPRPLFWLYLFVKWFLVSLGAAMLCGNLIMKWGWAAGIWFIVAPLVAGLVDGWRRLPAPDRPAVR